MSVRERIVCVRPVVGLIAARLSALVLLVSAMGLMVQPVSAGLVSGDSIPETTVLPTNVNILPDLTLEDCKKTVGCQYDNQGTFVLSVPITLQAGQSRRVSDQLTVTLNTGSGPEVDNNIECYDRSSGQRVGDSVGGGTNYQGSTLIMRASLFLTATQSGTFDCRIHAHTSRGHKTNYHMTAHTDTWPRGTWLEIDNFTTAPPQHWEAPFCDSQGKDYRCLYLSMPIQGSNSSTAVLYEDGPSWTAAPEAITADLAAHMQITSCFYGTASCLPIHWGGSWFGWWPADDTAVFRTHIEVLQVDPNGQPCQVTSTPDQQHVITNSVHHYLVDYFLPQIKISATCGGSRTFKLRAVVTWISGNPVKIDSGTATNANVIVLSTRPTTTVPRVIGVDQGEVAGPLTGRGLTMGTVTRVVNPTRPGIVIAQNSPEGTIEPISSPVDLTISLGAVTVPDLNGDTNARAVSELTALGLVARIELSAQCIAPGDVIDQTPSAGTIVAPGSTVAITIDTAPPKKCQVK